MALRRVLLLAWLAFLVPDVARPATISVFAAASLTDSMKEIATAYEKQTGNKVALNFGASGILARQIEEGAPADVFISADEARMDGLEQKGLLVKATRTNRLSNLLVVVVAADSPLRISSVRELAGAEVKRIALADPKTVPAGSYAREYLEQVKLWPAIGPKVVPTDNVRAALGAVESGNVEAGMVYKTDAAISRKVRIACEIPSGEGPASRYPMAVVKETRQPEIARRFLKYLASDEAGRVFKRFGFIVGESVTSGPTRGSEG